MAGTLVTEVEDDEEEEDKEEDVDKGDVVEGVRRTLLERGRLAGPGFLWTSPSMVTSCGGPEAARNRVQAATGAQRIPPVSSAATPTASGPPPACLVSLSATGVDRKIVGSVAGVQSDAVVRGAPAWIAKMPRKPSGLKRAFSGRRSASFSLPGIPYALIGTVVHPMHRWGYMQPALDDAARLGEGTRPATLVWLCMFDTPPSRTNATQFVPDSLA